MQKRHPIFLLLKHGFLFHSSLVCTACDACAGLSWAMHQGQCNSGYMHRGCFIRVLSMATDDHGGPVNSNEGRSLNSLLQIGQCRRTHLSGKSAIICMYVCCVYVNIMAITNTPLQTYFHFNMARLWALLYWRVKLPNYILHTKLFTEPNLYNIS